MAASSAKELALFEFMPLGSGDDLKVGLDFIRNISQEAAFVLEASTRSLQDEPLGLFLKTLGTHSMARHA